MGKGEPTYDQLKAENSRFKTEIAGWMRSYHNMENTAHQNAEMEQGGSDAYFEYMHLAGEYHNVVMMLAQILDPTWLERSLTDASGRDAGETME